MSRTIQIYIVIVIDQHCPNVAFDKRMLIVVLRDMLVIGSWNTLEKIE